MNNKKNTHIPLTLKKHTAYNNSKRNDKCKRAIGRMKNRNPTIRSIRKQMFDQRFEATLLVCFSPQCGSCQKQWLMIFAPESLTDHNFFLSVTEIWQLIAQNQSTNSLKHLEIKRTKNEMKKKQQDET